MLVPISVGRGIMTCLRGGIGWIGTGALLVADPRDTENNGRELSYCGVRRGRRGLSDGFFGAVLSGAAVCVAWVGTIRPPKPGGIPGGVDARVSILPLVLVNDARVLTLIKF